MANPGRAAKAVAALINTIHSRDQFDDAGIAANSYTTPSPESQPMVNAVNKKLLFVQAEVGNMQKQTEENSDDIDTVKDRVDTQEKKSLSVDNNISSATGIINQLEVFLSNIANNIQNIADHMGAYVITLEETRDALQVEREASQKDAEPEQEAPPTLTEFLGSLADVEKRGGILGAIGGGVASGVGQQAASRILKPATRVASKALGAGLDMLLKALKNPKLLILGLVAAAGYGLYKFVTSDKFKETVADVFNKMLNFGKELLDPVIGFFRSMKEGLFNLIANVFDKLADFEIPLGSVLQKFGLPPSFKPFGYLKSASQALRSSAASPQPAATTSTQPATPAATESTADATPSSSEPLPVPEAGTSDAQLTQSAIDTQPAAVSEVPAAPSTGSPNIGGLFGALDAQFAPQISRIGPTGKYAVNYYDITGRWMLLDASTNKHITNAKTVQELYQNALREGVPVNELPMDPSGPLSQPTSTTPSSSAPSVAGTSSTSSGGSSFAGGSVTAPDGAASAGATTPSTSFNAAAGSPVSPSPSVGESLSTLSSDIKMKNAKTAQDVNVVDNSKTNTSRSIQGAMTGKIPSPIAARGTIDIMNYFDVPAGAGNVPQGAM